MQDSLPNNSQSALESVKSLLTIKTNELKEIKIQRGRAFGAGDHATTKAALLLMEETLLTSPINYQSFLDVGCGTGIFAIWASKFGFQQIIATDIDDDAIEASQYNRSLNQVYFEIHQNPTPPAGSYDVIVANILPPALNLLFPSIKERLSDHGIFFIAGFNDSNFQEIKTEWIKAGFVDFCTRNERGWIAVALKHKN